MDQIKLLKIPYSHRLMTIAELLKLQPQYNSLTFKKGDYIIYRHTNGVFIAQVDKYVSTMRKVIVNGFHISNSSMGECRDRTIYLQGNVYVKITEDQYKELEKKYQEILLKLQCFNKKNQKQLQFTKPYEIPHLVCQPNKADIFTININFIQDHDKVTLGELYDKAEKEYESKKKSYQECYQSNQNYIGKTFIRDNLIMNITSVEAMNCGLRGDLIEITDNGVSFRSHIYLGNLLKNSYECDNSLFQQYFSYIDLILKLRNNIEMNFFCYLTIIE